MSGPIVRLRGEQFDAAMQFLNRCFGERQPMDFAHMLPSIYQPHDGSMQNNYAIIEDGEIAALVGLFPIKLRVGDVTLRLAGVGGVSTAPERRGRGLMSRLMTYVRDEIVRQGYDLSYLGGARQRYRHFGWERSGTQLCVVLGKTARTAGASGIAFDEAPSDSAALSRIRALHDALPIHCVRDEETVARVLGCWYRTWWTARDGERIVGYLVADKNGAYVPEIVADDDATLVRIALAWAERSDAPVKFMLPALPAASLRALGELADSVDTKKSGNWQILNWTKVLDAALRLGHRTQRLLVGETVIGLPDGQKLHMEVREHSAGCSAAPPQRNANFECEPMRLLRALFGPQPPRLALGDVPTVQLLDSWCPLPLAISDQDQV